jgi:hypothetical protein
VAVLILHKAVEGAACLAFEKTFHVVIHSNVALSS